MRQIILLVHDIRSVYNVGSLLRTADCLGVSHVYFTGYTPYPKSPEDTRLPHLAKKLDNQIHKTALGAERSVPWSHQKVIESIMQDLKADGFTIAALEQSQNSIRLDNFKPPEKIALLLGREVEGIDTSLMAHCDVTLEIPLFGKKESFNVVQAAAIALYQLRFY